MPLLNRHGVHIYYEVHGSGRPLILSHGFSFDSTMWKSQVGPLAKDFKVIIWDMRGHGRSDSPSEASEYSETHTVEDMGALLDETCGGGTMAVVGGLSLGGYMSLAFYRAHPSRVAALLLVDTGPGFKKDAARADWNQQAYRTADSYERDGLPTVRQQSPENSPFAHRNARGLARAARGMLAQRDGAIMNILPNIQVPSLIVVGADDAAYLAASEYMLKKIPNARKTVIPDAGHVANIDQPVEFLHAVRSFLREFGSPKATL